MKIGLAGALLSAAMMLMAADNGNWRNDVQLRAMADELARSKTLQLNTLDKPYFIQYVSEDGRGVSIAASLGGVTNSSQFRVRRPSVVVRVGSYGFDDTNSIYSGGRQFGIFPLDDDYGVMRTLLWRSTDAIYKGALNQIAAKRNALREVADPDKTPDLAPAKSVQVLEQPQKFVVDQAAWRNWVREASARFALHPDVLTSGIRFRAIDTTYRMVNSEGTILRIRQPLTDIEIGASTRASDGRRVWNHMFAAALDVQSLPPGQDIAGLAEQVAIETGAIANAPLGEDYTGPVLFEREAAAEMIAEVFTDTVVLHRKPVAPPNANMAALQTPESVWATRVGAKVLPDWLSAYDDPTITSYRGIPLAGAYDTDDEGVSAQRVALVEKGVFKGFLLSREPVRTYNLSNGHGRMPGPFGSELAAIGNLFIEASNGVPQSQLRAKLLEKVKAAGLRYGLIIRRMDFPSTADFSELQGIARQAKQSGYSRTLNAPLLVYRLYQDGHEELVRGLRFREFSAKNLRDLASASDDSYVLNYVNNGSSLNLNNSSSSIVLSSVVCPSLLLDSVDLGRSENEGDLPPVVPAPALVSEK